MPRIAIIGTGTWGTAMAMQVAALERSEVVLWGRDPDKVTRLDADRRHPRFDERGIPEAVTLTADPAALTPATLVLWAVPTQHSAAIAERLAPHLPATTPVVSLAKGLEQAHRRRVSEVLAATLGDARAYGCLSGPSHAEEVVAGLPVALVAAGPDRVTDPILEHLHGRNLRIYTSTDLVGVELGGALKNVIAVAAGICDGLRLGDNAKAALLTRGVAEMRRLGRHLGAQDATFAGLAGIGDLLATCYSPHGRNRALGLAVARGTEATTHMDRSGMVAEGAWTCRAAVDLGRHHACEMPIASQVASILWDGTNVPAAIDALLRRAAKSEDA